MDFTDDTFEDKNDNFTINGNIIDCDTPIEPLIKPENIKKENEDKKNLKDTADASKAATATNEVSITKKSIPILCKMCDARILYEKSAESHFDGNKHKRKVKRYQLMKAIAKEFGIAIEDSNSSVESDPNFNQISFLEKQVEKFLCCPTCNISVTGFDNMLVHLSSSKHFQAVEKQQNGNRNATMKPQMRPPAPPVKMNFERFNPTSTATSQFNRPPRRSNPHQLTKPLLNNRGGGGKFSNPPYPQKSHFRPPNYNDKPPPRPREGAGQFNYEYGNSGMFSNPYQQNQWMPRQEPPIGMPENGNFPIWNTSRSSMPPDNNRNQGQASYRSPLKRKFNTFDDSHFTANKRPHLY